MYCTTDTCMYMYCTTDTCMYMYCTTDTCMCHLVIAIDNTNIVGSERIYRIFLKLN